MSTLSELAAKFEKLLGGLPGPIRVPAQKAWQPLNELFLQARAPRLLLLGKGTSAFLQQCLFPTQESPFATPAGSFANTASGWQTFRHGGLIEYSEAIDHPHAALAALHHAAADAVIIVLSSEDPIAELQQQSALLAEILAAQKEAATRSGGVEEPPIYCFTERELPHHDTSALWGALEPSLSGELKAILPLGNRSAVLQSIATALPPRSQLEFARATREKSVQRKIAHSLINSTSSVCGAIGIQPIPLADFPILSSLQLLMIGGIIHVSGREWTTATVRSFIAALGFNVGAGLLLREGARSVIKVFPGFLNLVSGAMAGAGTYGIGHAASAFFIDDLAIREARRHAKLALLPRRPGKRKKLVTEGEAPAPSLKTGEE